MLLAARRDAGLQRLGWMPLFGFIGGCVSYVSMQNEYAVARVAAAMLLSGWVWLCFQTSIRYKFHKIRIPGGNDAAIDLVMRGVQQGILFFSLPFLWSVDSNPSNSIARLQKHKMQAISELQQSHHFV